MSRITRIRILYLSLVVLLVSPVSLDGQAKRIYIAPDDHTDLWWLADPAAYDQAFLTMLDYYINLADYTQNEAPDNQSRWNCDGNYWMWIYQKSRSAQQFQKLISYIKSGHISVPLNPLAVVWGATPVEAVIRGMYYPGKIERKYDLRLPLVYTMENQTLPLGLATIWAEAGAKYSWKGICQCNSLVDATDRDHDIYWMQGLDGSKILMKWYSLLGDNTSVGGYAEARDPMASIDFVENNSAFKARYPYPVIGLFGKGWDDLQTLTDEFISVSKSASNSNREVIVSNEIDFFKDFESNFGNDISSRSLSFGNDWELGAAAIQEVSSRLKRSTEKLRNSEAISTIAALPDPSLLTGREDSKDQAWMNMGIYFEHNIPMHPGPYPSDTPSRRTAWQKNLVAGIESYLNSLQSDALAQFGNMIINNSTNARFFVFNSLNWTRTDVADLEYALAGPVRVVDISTSLEVPSQFVQIGGKTYLRILARDVPPLGYKVFEIYRTAGQSFPDAATIAGNTIENSYYKLTATEKGSVTSLLSKKHGNQEFVRSINGKTVNDMGGTATGSVTVENSGPVSASLVINSSSPLSHTTRITLFRDIDRIDISNSINQNFVDIRSWAYGFEVPAHTIRHEEVGAILSAKTASHGGNYSDKNANYDWLTINHFADVSNDTYGITLSNADCYFMKTGSSTTTSLDESTPQVNVLAGGRINNFGQPDQGGDTQFTQRFALETHNTYTPLAAMRFSLEHQNPFLSGKVGNGIGFPEKSMSLFTIDNPDVIIWSMKPSEEGIGAGVILRLWNLSQNSSDFKISSAFKIESAQNVSLIETPVSSAPVNNNSVAGQINGFGFKTLNIKVGYSSAGTLSVSPETRSVSSDPGNTTFSVNSNLAWTVSDDSPWIVVTKADGSTVNVTYEANTSVNSRNGKIIVAASGGISDTVILHQVGSASVLEVFPSDMNVNSESGTAIFSVTTNLDWSLTDNAPWLTAVKRDAASIEVSYTENTSFLSRSGKIIVSGTGGISDTVILIQEGMTESLSIVPDTISVGPDGGVTSFSVIANMDWSVASQEAWLTANQSNPETIGVSYEKNPDTIPRYGHIVVSGITGLNETAILHQEGESTPDSSGELKDFTALLFPNPVSGSLIVKLGEPVFKKIFVTLSDQVGKLVMKKLYYGTSPDGTLTADMTYLYAGIYFLSIRIGNIIKVYKVIRE